VRSLFVVNRSSDQACDDRLCESDDAPDGEHRVGEETQQMEADEAGEVLSKPEGNRHDDSTPRSRAEAGAHGGIEEGDDQSGEEADDNAPGDDTRRHLHRQTVRCCHQNFDGGPSYLRVRATFAGGVSRIRVQ